MKHKPSHDLREDIGFYSMIIKTVPLVALAVSAAVLPLALYDTFTATALVVYGCAAAGSVMLVLHLRRRARQALLRAQIEEAFDRCAMERLDRLERVLNGWEKGVVPERDWHIMSGGKPLPEHLRK